MQELQKDWAQYKEQSGDEVTDYSKLYESEDRIQLKRAIRRLEENKRQARDAQSELGLIAQEVEQSFKA